MLQMSSRDRPLMIERDDEEHEADFDRARSDRASCRLRVNSLASTAAIVCCGASSDSDIFAVVADHHRHGHRLAERAAEAEHDRADDAGARVVEGGA